MLTLRQDDSQAEEEDDEDAGLMVECLADIPSPELALLLAQCDLLHAGDSGKKAEGFQLLMENRPLVRYFMITEEIYEKVFKLHIFDHIQSKSITVTICFFTNFYSTRMHEMD